MTDWRDDVNYAPKDEPCLFWLDWSDDVKPLNPPLADSPWRCEQLTFTHYGRWASYLKPVMWAPVKPPART